MSMQTYTSISVWLRGDRLIPNDVSTKVGVECDWGQTKGEKFISKSGKITEGKIGFWRIKENDTPLSIDETIAKLLEPLNNVNLIKLDNVEDAFLDIYINVDQSVIDKTGFELQISNVNLSKIANLGLLLSATIYTTNK